jgi:hypothetical protein
MDEGELISLKAKSPDAIHRDFLPTEYPQSLQ